MVLLGLGLVGASVGLILVLNLTTPAAAGPVGILAVFVLIYLASFCALMLFAKLLELIWRAVRPPTGETVVAGERARASRTRVTLIAAVLSLVPIFLISLNSIGQLNFVDVVLIVLIEALAVFYLARRV